MKETLKSFILKSSFPCLMAKAVAKKGNLHMHTFKNLTKESVLEILEKIYLFIDEYRENPDKLSSFIISFTDEKYHKFEVFEDAFWSLLDELKSHDHVNYEHDGRVASSPEDPRYSYSLKEEAFFILLLHPDSPRIARRYKHPSIVFNPHHQFERLREGGKFKKIRDLIRMRDKKLQGYINPMLKDHGESSELLQYTGRHYESSKAIKEVLKEKVFI